jgi:hypothetical protein
MFNEGQRAEAAKQGIDRVNALINAGNGQARVGEGYGTLQSGMNADSIAQAGGYMDLNTGRNKAVTDQSGMYTDQANLGMDQQRLQDNQNMQAYQMATGRQVDPNTMYQNMINQGQQPLQAMMALISSGGIDFESDEGKALLAQFQGMIGGQAA